MPGGGEEQVAGVCQRVLRGGQRMCHDGKGGADLSVHRGETSHMVKKKHAAGTRCGHTARARLQSQISQNLPPLPPYSGWADLIFGDLGGWGCHPIFLHIESGNMKRCGKMRGWSDRQGSVRAKKPPRDQPHTSLAY